MSSSEEFAHQLRSNFFSGAEEMTVEDVQQTHQNTKPRRRVGGDLTVTQCVSQKSDLYCAPETQCGDSDRALSIAWVVGRTDVILGQ